MFNFWKLKNLYFLVHWRVTYFHNNNTHFLKMSNFFDFSQINIFQIKKKKVWTNFFLFTFLTLFKIIFWLDNRLKLSLIKETSLLWMFVSQKGIYFAVWLSRQCNLNLNQFRNKRTKLNPIFTHFCKQFL